MKEPIVDCFKIIGYIEKQPNGEAIIFDRHEREIGYLMWIGNELLAFNNRDEKLGVFSHSSGYTVSCGDELTDEGKLLAFLYQFED